MGIEINVAFTGDSTIAKLKKAPGACLNLVQCTGSMHWLQGIWNRDLDPFHRCELLGAENTAGSLRKIARFYNDPAITARTEMLIEREMARIEPALQMYREKLTGKRAAIYVGGAYKALAIIQQFRNLGMEIVMTGTQTGKKEDYNTISGLLNPGTIIIDDANPADSKDSLLKKRWM